MSNIRRAGRSATGWGRGGQRFRGAWTEARRAKRMTVEHGTLPHLGPGASSVYGGGAREALFASLLLSGLFLVVTGIRPPRM